MSWKSDTCTGRVSGEPLTEYASEAEAREAAEWVREEHGRRMRPYSCRRCGGWHLGLADRHTPSHSCSWCQGRDGRTKATYRSESDAERRADIIRREQGVDLRAYECPHGSGWHLTKEAGYWRC